MSVPNFLIIGAQRSGSTWLWHEFGQHPEIFLPDVKELEYFSYTSNLSAAGWASYQQRFAGRTEPWLGEATPAYFMTIDERSAWHSPKRGFNADIPQAVHDRLGSDVRLVLSLRHPVDRAISAFFHHARRGRIRPGESILDAGRDHMIVDGGFYGRHLERWLEFFPLENFLIETTSAIAREPAAVLDRAQRFFDLDQPFSRPGVPRNRGSRVVWVNGKLRPLRPLRATHWISQEEIDSLRDIYTQDLERLQARLGRSILPENPSHSDM